MYVGRQEWALQGNGMLEWSILESDCLGLNPSSATYCLGDFEQVT